MSMWEIQQELKVPKANFNSFGKYAYRTAGDIIELAKPILAKYNYYLIITDEIVNLGDRYYFKATSSVYDKDNTLIASAVGIAREAVDQKGMLDAQLSGSTSSYARKYSLSGLFALDDTKDPDAEIARKNANEKEKLESQSPEMKAKLAALAGLTTVGTGGASK